MRNLFIALRWKRSSRCSVSKRRGRESVDSVRRHLLGKGITLPALPAGFVRMRTRRGSPSPAAFLARTCISYSVPGFRSTTEKWLSGVSKPKLHASVPASRMPDDVGQPGFPVRFEHLAVLDGQADEPVRAVPLNLGRRFTLPVQGGASAVEGNTNRSLTKFAFTATALAWPGRGGAGGPL